MAEPFDAIRYIGYLKSRWRSMALSAVVAGVLAGALSLAMTKQFTATARIVIEPPAGTDMRSAMAVSPIYLESLRTYEHFAASDSLFRKAVDQLKIRSLAGSGSIEGLKRRVLKVGIVRNTRILEVSVTLPDAVKAQALGQYLAEESVTMNRSVVAQGDSDLVNGAGQQAVALRERLAQLDREWAQLLAKEPVRELQTELDKSTELLSRMREQVLTVELDLVEEGQRGKQAGAEERSLIEKQAASSRVRLEELRRQMAALERQNLERERTLAERQGHREKAEAERKAAQAALVAAETRLREVQGDAGYRGERLRIIDPGVVPERPSSPNVPLNVIAAMLVALVLALLYLTLAMNYEEHRAAERRSPVRSFARVRDE